MKRKRVIQYSVFYIALAALFSFFVFKYFLKTQSVVLCHVRPFSFTNQNGQSFTEKNMKGKVCVVSFFSTQCQSTCPVMNANLHKVYNEFQADSNLIIISHTWNPNSDSVSALKQYALQLHVNTPKWIFLTGAKDSLYLAAHNSYLLDDADLDLDNIDTQFLHTKLVALVDKNGQVRGQLYDALKQKDLQKLRIDIKVLLKEREEADDEFVNSVL